MQKNKLIIGFISFCLILVWAKTLLQDNALNDQPQLSTITSQLNTAQQQKESNQNTTSKSRQAPKVNSPKEAILQEIVDRKFSNDPYTELLSLRAVINHCINHVEIDEMATYYGIAYPIHETTEQEVQNQCRLNQQHYPELIKAFKSQQWTTLFNPQSKLGHLLKSLLDPNTTDTDRKELSRLTLLEAIRKQNGVIMTQTRNFARLGMKEHVFPITELLQSHDYKYVDQINQTAINLMSCQFNQGTTCENNSVLMQLVCAKNPLACGQDYQTWFQENTLTGMKKDVQKLIEFYTVEAID